MKFRLTSVSMTVLAAATLLAANASAGPSIAAAGAYGASANVQVAAYSATVRDVQQALNSRGYDAGPVDGYMGGKTRNAISAYQRDNNLLVTGQASDSLRDHIQGSALPQVISKPVDAKPAVDEG